MAITCVHQLLQSCSTLCHLMDRSPPGSSVHGIFQEEYWSGLPCPLLGDPPDPGIKPESLTSHALTGGFFTTSPIWKPLGQSYGCSKMGGTD